MRGSHQRRRRGQAAKVWTTGAALDRRGNDVIAATDVAPFDVRAVFLPARSAKAEVPGQQQINVYTMIVEPGLEGVELWSRVQWNGAFWDVVTPPQHHEWTRQTKLISLEIRQRP